jgi:hypothetical protein
MRLYVYRILKLQFLNSSVIRLISIFYLRALRAAVDHRDRYRRINPRAGRGHVITLCSLQHS